MFGRVRQVVALVGHRIQGQQIARREGAKSAVNACVVLWCTSTVSEHSRDVHAHFQPHLHDAAAWSLEWLSSVLRAHDTGLPTRHVGRH